MSIKSSELFSFNAVDVADFLDSHGYFFKVTNTTGRELIQQDHTLTSVSGVDGARLLDTLLPSRTITVDYTVRSDTYLDLRKLDDLLGQLFIGDQTKRLSFYDQEGYYDAIYESKEVSLETDIVQQGSLTFTCPKPFRYAKGVTIPSTSVNSTGATLNVNTNYQIEPVLSFKVNASAPTLTITVGSHRLLLEEAVTSATTVTVDVSKAEVRVGNVVKVLEISGEFPIFYSGENTIKTTVNTTLTGSYTEIYV